MGDDTLKDIRHPDARHKTRNRSGQAGGLISKSKIDKPFNWRKVEMQESPAYRVLSLSARRVMDRLEIEFARHGLNPMENGSLPCTYDDFVEYGVDRHAIAPAIRELVALGFIQVTRKGSAGNEAHRQVTLYLLTYRHAGSDARIEDGWKRIKTIEEAEAVAKAARAGNADRRAAEFGRKGGAARWAKNKSPVMENALSRSDGKHTEGVVSPVMETEPLSILSRGRGNAARKPYAPTAPLTPPDVLLHAMVDKLPWSPPRRVETSEIDRKLSRLRDGSASHRTVPVEALAALEGLLLSNKAQSSPPPRFFPWGQIIASSQAACRDGLVSP